MPVDYFPVLYVYGFFRSGTLTLLVEKLTDDEPVNPEVVVGLTSVERVFSHYKPHADVEFRNGEGLPVNETFHFRSVGDFSVKSLTERSVFLKRTDMEKSFYDNLVKQLRTNKVLQRVLENPEARRAFLSSLEAMAAELGEAE
jgi:hypothetical protein